MTRVSTHVLDTSTGTPVSGLRVRLDDTVAVTDPAGRASLGEVEPGDHQLVFATGEYFATTLYPVVTISFTVAAGEIGYHLPLLLSPFGYSTYRGT